MGAAIGTGEKKSPNIELNIVPFIDMMSCITAFLLVTAVWVNTANVPTHTEGLNRDGLNPPKEDPQLSVLVEKDKIWVGVSRLDDFTQIERTPAGTEWKQLEDALKTQKSSTYFADTHRVEVAALSTSDQAVPYANLITAMDIASKVGFDDVIVTEPSSLSATPHRM